MSKLNVQKLKARDEQALKDLFDLLAPKITRMVQSTLPARDLLEAEDIVQEVFLKIYTNLDKIVALEDPKKIERYCLAIARNVASYSLYRFRAQERTVDAYESLMPQLIEFVQEGRLKEALKEALSKLSEDERRLIQMRVAGMKTKEIAEKLQVSVKTTYTRQARALERLKRYLLESEEIGI